MGALLDGWSWNGAARWPDVALAICLTVAGIALCALVWADRR